MRIWILSDLHTENQYWTPPAIPDADVCVLAGDIARGAREAVEWAGEHIRPHMPVVGVLGNHEFYRHYLGRERSAAQHHGWHLDIAMLDDMTWTDGNVRFVGATLWTDYLLYASPSDPERRFRDQSHAMATAAARMNDHRLILRDDGRRFMPSDALRLHRESVAFLEETLSTPFDGDTIVVTHHCPHPRSVDAVYQGDPLTPAFCSDLSSLIERHQPTAWIHGHTHTSFDYHVGATRVVCNPHGYGSENRRGFDPGLVIEIGEPRPRPPGL